METKTKSEIIPILISGGAGLIGSNCFPIFLERDLLTQFVNLDKLSYAGILKHLDEQQGHPDYSIIHGDICDRALDQRIFSVQLDDKDQVHRLAKSY